MIKECNGIKFEGLEKCKYCGSETINYVWYESNKAIGARCANCDKFQQFMKYDSRTREQIRKDKIEEWKKARNMK